MNSVYTEEFMNNLLAYRKTTWLMNDFTQKLKSFKSGFKYTLVFSLLCLLSAFTAQSQNRDVSPYCNGQGSSSFTFLVGFNIVTGPIGAIDSVKIGNVTNYNTGSNQDGSTFGLIAQNEDVNVYFDALADIQATLGDTLDGSVTTITTPQILTQTANVAIWVDFDQNETFDDDEIVYASSKADTEFNFSFPIPSDAKCGVTRLRVVSGVFQAPNDPCEITPGGANFGEYEDYDIEINPKSVSDDLALSIAGPKPSINPSVTELPATPRLGIENFKVKVGNVGNNTISAGSTVPIKYIMDPAKSPQTFNYTLQSDLASCNNREIDVDTLNLACQEEITLKAWHDRTGDPNAFNDTGSVTFDQRTEVSVFSEDFESGSSNQFTRFLNGGQALFTSDNSLAGPAFSGDYHALLHDGGRPYIETSVDLSVGQGDYFLEFRWKHAQQERCEPGDGIFVSTNGGATFTQIRELCTKGPPDTWIPFRIDLNEALQNNGLSTSGNAIIRLACENNAAYQGVGVDGEGQAYDDIRIFRRKPVRFSQPSNLSIVAPDTFFQGSPTRIQAGFSLADELVVDWIYDGQKLASNQSEIVDTFTASNPPKTADLEMVVAGCFGADTVSKQVTVAQPTQAPNPDFSASRNIVEVGDQVDFTNLTTKGGTTFTWNILPSFKPNGNPSAFWVGNNTFRERDTFEPRAEFLEPGVYDVYLIAGNAQGADTITKRDFIRVREFYDVCSDTRETDTVGTLTDGNDPGYPSDANCAFTIDPCTQNIDLSINELDLKNGSAYLRIYDGSSSSGTPLWDVSAYGNKGLTGDQMNQAFQQEITATSGSVYVEFESGSSPEGSGFEIGWNGNSSSLPALSSSIVGDTAVCEGLNASFGANSPATNPTFEWYVNKKNLGSTAPDGNGANFVTTIQDANNDTVRLVTTACGRRDVTSVVVTPQTTTSKPQVDFVADRRVIGVGDTVRLAETTPACVSDRAWSIAPNNYRFVNGTDANSADPVVVFDQEGAYLVALSNTTNGNTSGSEQKTGFIRVVDYCDPSVLSLSSDIGVSRFALEEIDNSSSIGNQAYTNYANETNVAMLIRDASLPLTIERNTSFNPVSYAVWIDFNSDGEFGNNREKVFEVDGFEGSTLTDTLNVPNNASFGTYRLRVGANLQNVPNRGCGPNKYGEYEDYKVQIVPDQKGPDITLSGGDTVTLEACNSASGFIRNAFAEDLVDGRINNLTVNGSVDPQTPGFYNVRYEVTDQNGNTSQRDQVFEVLPDQIAPTFNVVGPDPYQLGANQPFNDPGVTDVEDNCPATPSVSVDDSDLNSAQLGSYEVTYTVTDGSGNSATKTRTVKVTDTTDPQAELAGDNPLRHPVDEPFTDPGLQNVSDNFWPGNEITVTTKGQVDFGTVGEYERTYVVEDGSGNTIQLTRDVVVDDYEAPQVSAEFTNEPTRDDTLEVQVNQQANIRQALTITDNTGSFEVASVTGNFFQQFPDGVPNVLGDYTVGYEVVDTSGNQTSVSFTVEVVDEVEPTISLKGQDVVRIPRFDTTAYESVDSVTVSDNYYADFQLSVQTAGSYFDTYKDTFSSGSYDIKYTVSDPSGNSASVSRSVITGESTGLQSVDGIENLSAYPNPVEAELQIRLKGDPVEDGRLTLTNVLGQEVNEIAEGRLGGAYQLNVADYEAGIYFLRLSTEEEVKHQKLIVQ